MYASHDFIQIHCETWHHLPQKLGLSTTKYAHKDLLVSTNSFGIAYMGQFFGAYFLKSAGSLITKWLPKKWNEL